MPSARQLMEVLQRREVLAPEQLKQVERQLARRRGSLVRLLVEHHDLSEAALHAVLQRHLGVGAVGAAELAGVTLDQELRRRVPVSLARACVALPLHLDRLEGVLTVVMADPTDQQAVDRLRRVARVGQVAVRLAPTTSILAALERAYSREPPRHPPAGALPQLGRPAERREAERGDSLPAAGPGLVPGELAPLWPGELDTLTGELLDATGVLVAMLQERIDPTGGDLHELGRLCRLTARELELDETTVGRISLAGQLVGLDIAMKREVGTHQPQAVAEVFGDLPGLPGGLSPSLRSLGARALGLQAQRGAGPAPLALRLVDLTAAYLWRRMEGDEAGPPAALLADLAAAEDAELLRALERALAVAERPLPPIEDEEPLPLET